MRVAKFPISLGVTEVELPVDAKVLSVEAKSGQAAVYALVPYEAVPGPATTHRFFAVETGDNVEIERGEDVDPLQLDETNSSFLGTVRQPGQYTWHVFEVAQTLPAGLTAAAAEAHA